MHGQVGDAGDVDAGVVAGGEQRVHVVGGDVELGHAGPAGGDRELGAVLLGEQAHRGRLDPQREVLGDDGDVVALGLEVAGDRQDPGVGLAAADPVAGRQYRGVRVVELDPDGAAELADRDRLVQAPEPDPEVVEQPQRLAGEVAQLRVVPLGLQLGDHDHGEDDLVLLETGHRQRVRQQHTGVENVRPPVWCPAALGTDH